MHSIGLKYCQNCHVCIKDEALRGKPFGNLGHLGPPTQPFEIMFLNTVGGFVGRRSTKKYCILLVDRFSHFAYILTSKNQMASQFIRLVKGVPKVNRRIG